MKINYEHVRGNQTMCGVGLFDFSRILKVVFFWGVYRLGKTLRNVSEENLETGIPLKGGRKWDGMVF